MKDIRRNLGRFRTLALFAGGVVGTAQAAVAQYTAAVPSSVIAGYGSGQVIVKGLPNVANCGNPAVTFGSWAASTEAVQRLATAALVTGNTLNCQVIGCEAGMQSGRWCELRDE